MYKGWVKKYKLKNQIYTFYKIFFISIYIDKNQVYRIGMKKKCGLRGIKNKEER